MSVVFRTCRAGAFHGAVTGAIYCLVEFGFLYLAAFLVDPAGAALTGWDWAFTLASLAIYVGAGAVAGAALGLLLAALRRFRDGLEAGNFLEAMATLCFVLPIAAQFLIRSLRSTLTQVALAACLLVMLGLVMRAFAGTRRPWLVRAMNPWSAFIIALGVPWWWKTAWSGGTQKAAAALCLAALVVFFAILATRLRFSESGTGPALPVQPALASGVIGAVFGGAGLLLAGAYYGAKRKWKARLFRQAHLMSCSSCSIPCAGITRR